jgi:hypothetical protein
VVAGRAADRAGEPLGQAPPVGPAGEDQEGARAVRRLQRVGGQRGAQRRLGGREHPGRDDRRVLDLDGQHRERRAVGGEALGLGDEPGARVAGLPRVLHGDRGTRAERALHQLRARVRETVVQRGQQGRVGCGREHVEGRTAQLLHRGRERGGARRRPERLALRQGQQAVRLPRERCERAVVGQRGQQRGAQRRRTLGERRAGQAARRLERRPRDAPHQPGPRHRPGVGRGEAGEGARGSHPRPSCRPVRRIAAGGRRRRHSTSGANPWTRT